MLIRCLLCLVLLGMPQSEALSSDEPFTTWLSELRSEAARIGIRQSTLESALKGVRPREWIIELDRRQPEFTLSLKKYITERVTPRRIQKARELLKEHHPLFAAIAREYRVPPHVLLALWGIETNFGRLTGTTPVFDALVTLAYDGRRSAYFRNELLNALRLVEQGIMRPRQMTGSWAGAMGQVQFMPSSVLGYAVDGNRDGRIDLWSTPEDYLRSAANYLSEHGWQAGYRWGRPVSLPEERVPGIEAGRTRALGQWHDLGIRRADGGHLPDISLDARLLQPDPDGQAYLVYTNYDVLLRWNRADSFALAVGQLADAIAGDR